MMAFKKTGDACLSVEIYGEELESGEIFIEVEHSHAELHDPYKVEEEEKDSSEIEETIDDYLLARDMSRRVIKTPQRLDYADLIAFALIFATEVLEEEHRDY